MNATIVTTTSTVFLCPECNTPHTSQYSHTAPGQSFGPWYCKECGCGVTGIVTEQGVTFTSCESRCTKTLVLLRLDAELKKPIHIVVEGAIYHKKGDDLKKLLAEQQAKDEYLYNQHICPSSYLGCQVKEGDDTDPHGLFVHRQTVLMPKGYDGTLDRADENGSGGSYPDVKVWTETFPSLRAQSEN